MVSRRRLGPIVAALVALIVMTGPVSAAPLQFVFREAGTSAYAESDASCTDNGDGTVTCSGTVIDVFEGRSKERGTSTLHSERACYSKLSGTFDAETGEPIELSGVGGCAFDSRTISIKSLRSITLAPTEIELVAIQCDADSCTEDPAGSIVVRGKFTGEGPVSRDRSKFRLDDGTCILADSSQGRFRGASFTGSADGVPFTSTTAAIGAGMFRLRISCPLL
jgi:hypothetical protein